MNANIIIVVVIALTNNGIKYFIVHRVCVDCTGCTGGGIRWMSNLTYRHRHFWLRFSLRLRFGLTCDLFVGCSSTDIDRFNIVLLVGNCWVLGVRLSFNVGLDIAIACCCAILPHISVLLDIMYGVYGGHTALTMWRTAVWLEAAAVDCVDHTFTYDCISGNIFADKILQQE